MPPRSTPHPFRARTVRILLGPWPAAFGAPWVAIVAIECRHLLGTGTFSRFAQASALALLVLTGLMLAGLHAQVTSGRRRAAALTGCSLAMAALGLCGAASLVVVGAAFGALPDGFGRDIEVPAGMVPRSPDVEPAPLPRAGDVASLMQLAATSPEADPAPPPTAFDRQAWTPKNRRDAERLLRYLQSQPGWRTVHMGSNRYQSTRELSHAQSTDWFRFRVTLTIDLDRQAQASPSARELHEAMKDHVPGVYTGSTGGWSTHLPFVTIEVTQASARRDRRLMLACLDILSAELLPVLSAAAWDERLLPAGAIASGPADIRLAGSHGVYEVDVYANPGEPGEIEIRAFEATRDTPLLNRTVRRMSGWSVNRTELFRIRERVLIHPGDWGVFYPARFEAWFTPGTGGAARKLAESTYRIEGWQK